MLLDDRTLRWLLQPVARWMTDPLTTDFCMNEPFKGWVKQKGVWFEVDTPYDLETLEDIGRHSAGLRSRDIWTDMPLCECTSPWGHRVFLVQHPCVLPGTYSYSARRASDWQPTIEGLAAGGLFKTTARFGQGGQRQAYVEPRKHYLAGDMPSFWRSVAENGLTLMLGGLMGGGKTTLLRAVGHAIPHTKRGASIEDEDEAKLTQPNRVSLVFSERGQGQAKVGPEELMKGTLRMAVQFVVNQELRGGPSAKAFLRLAAVLQCLTTNHGDSCFGVFDTTRLMLKDGAGSQMDDIDIFRTLNRYVDVVAHCETLPPEVPGGPAGYRVTETWFKGVDPPLGLTRAQVDAA